MTSVRRVGAEVAASGYLSRALVICCLNLVLVGGCLSPVLAGDDLSLGRARMACLCSDQTCRPVGRRVRVFPGAVRSY